MAEKDLNEKLSVLIQSCKDEGILGDYFDQVKELQDENQPKFVSNLIKIFIDEAGNDIEKITTILSEPEVNYAQVKYLAVKVHGANTSFGGSKVHNASRDLVAASAAENKADCLESFEVLDREYRTLKGKLTKIAQIENAIYDKKSKNDKKV